MFNARRYSYNELIEMEINYLPSSEIKDEIISFALQLVEKEKLLSGASK